MVEEQLVIIGEQQIQMVEVTVGLPSQHGVVRACLALLHHEEEARLGAAQQLGPVHGRAQQVVRAIEHHGRLAVAAVGGKGRLLVGLRLGDVVAKRRSIRPGAHFALRTPHAAPVKPQPQAKRG